MCVLISQMMHIIASNKVVVLDWTIYNVCIQSIPPIALPHASLSTIHLVCTYKLTNFLQCPSTDKAYYYINFQYKSMYRIKYNVKMN